MSTHRLTDRIIIDDRTTPSKSFHIIMDEDTLSIASNLPPLIPSSPPPIHHHHQQQHRTRALRVPHTLLLLFSVLLLFSLFASLQYSSPLSPASPNHQNNPISSVSLNLISLINGWKRSTDNPPSMQLSILALSPSSSNNNDNNNNNHIPSSIHFDSCFTTTNKKYSSKNNYRFLDQPKTDNDFQYVADVLEQLVKGTNNNNNNNNANTNNNNNHNHNPKGTDTDKKKKIISIPHWILLLSPYELLSSSTSDSLPSFIAKHTRKYPTRSIVMTQEWVAIKVDGWALKFIQAFNSNSNNNNNKDGNSNSNSNNNNNLLSLFMDTIRREEKSTENQHRIAIIDNTKPLMITLPMNHNNNNNNHNSNSNTNHHHHHNNNNNNPFVLQSPDHYSHWLSSLRLPRRDPLSSEWRQCVLNEIQRWRDLSDEGNKKEKKQAKREAEILMGHI